MKRCKTCSVVLTELNWQSSYQKRWYYLCKECDKVRQRDYAKTRPKRRFFKRYGLDESTYSALVSVADGRCQICGTNDNKGKDLCIDHCHETGRVRGLLCHKCNMALGLFNDDPKLIDKAKGYLNESL